VTGVLAHLASVWRSIWTPKAAREVEDAGLQHALDAMPEPPPGPDPWAGLREARRRLDDTEARLRYLEGRRRLYERGREDGA
jgi:hypothetical protein